MNLTFIIEIMLFFLLIFFLIFEFILIKMSNDYIEKNTTTDEIIKDYRKEMSKLQLRYELETKYIEELDNKIIKYQSLLENKKNCKKNELL